MVKANNEEVILDTSIISDNDKEKIGKGCKLNSDMTITETQAYLDNINIETKEQKRTDIVNILSETDQLNMLAEILDRMNPNPTDEFIKEAKTKFANIKAILNK
jgi:hypothetical protein